MKMPSPHRAETPLAQLRKLVAELRQEAGNWRRCAAAETVFTGGSTDADCRAYTYDVCASKLSALLTDLEAAPRPDTTAGDLQNSEMPTDPRTRGRMGNAPKSFPHRCSGCGLRWQTTEAGSCAAELCGIAGAKYNRFSTGKPVASRRQIVPAARVTSRSVTVEITGRTAATH
jgi:hypothetical protein